ncbi:MAG: diguanylate cyclase [Candidatus Omnitrophica bacterium]|nr:diguanylate cyclase [Candidatus Omnitrophota bacterium]
MSEGIIVLSHKGAVTVADKAARALLNIDEAEVLNRETLEAKLKELDLYHAYEQAMLSKGETVVHQAVKPNPKDEAKPIKIRCHIGCMKGAGEDAGGVFFLLRNLTEEQEAEQKKSDFIGTVSHELRTPITAMSEFTSLLLDGVAGKINDQQKEYLKVINENVKRIRKVVDRILDTTDIEKQKVELNREVVNIGDLVGDVVSLYKPKAAQKHILLRMTSEGVMPNLFIDRGHIIQVLVHLLDNAIKFTPEWGKIWASIEDKGSEVQIVVKDTGIGIKEEDARSVFERFSQVDKSYGAGAKGVGLGLAICKDLVEMHDGRICVEGEEGKGSKFIVTLPRHNQEALINECLSDAVSLARKQHKPLSYMVLKVDNYAELEREYEKQGADELLTELWSALKKHVESPRDKVAIFGQAMAGAILPHRDKGAALALQRAIEDFLGTSSVSWKGKAVTPHAVFKVITYPDDAASVAEMRLLEERTA